MARRQNGAIVDGYSNLLAATIRQALRDLSARELEQRLDAVLFLLSPVCEDYMTLLGLSRVSPLRVIYEAGKTKRFQGSADVVSLISDLNRSQRILWRQMVLEELPRIRERVLKASREELARALDEHLEGGLEAVVGHSETFF